MGLSSPVYMGILIQILIQFGDKLDSNPDSDHAPLPYRLYSRFESGFGTWCSCKCGF